jgi:hypothetical protein
VDVSKTLKVIGTLSDPVKTTVGLLAVLVLGVIRIFLSKLAI